MPDIQNGYPYVSSSADSQTVGLASSNAQQEQISTKRGTTASRPSAVTVGAGARYYDTTLGKPIWSNGTIWTDATGTSA